MNPCDRPILPVALYSEAQSSCDRSRDTAKGRIDELVNMACLALNTHLTHKRLSKDTTLYIDAENWTQCAREMALYRINDGKEQSVDT